MSKGTPTSTKKFFNLWQKTAEERKLLADGKEQRVSYGHNGVTTAPAPAFRKTQSPGTANQPNGRNHIVPVIKPGNISRTASTISSQRLSSIPDDSTIANSSSDDVFDEGSVKGSYTEQYTNPVYDWVNESSLGAQPVVNIRSDHHPVTAVPPALAMADSPKVEFNKLPFSCYSRRCAGGTWWSALLQGTSVALGVALLPFIVIAVALFFMKTRYRPKMTRVERRKETIWFSLLLFVALVKDLVVVAVIINGSTYLPYLTTFRTLTPLVWFSWPVLFCCIPATCFYYADYRYDFGVNPVKKVCAQLASHFGIAKAAPLVNTVAIQGVYLNKNYPMIAAISGSNDELPFVKSVTSKLFIVTGIVLSVVVGCIRIIPLLFEMSYLSRSCHHQGVNKSLMIKYDEKIWNEGIPMESFNCSKFYIPLMLIASGNLVFVTLIFFMWFLYVLAWKIAILNEWKIFNDNERDDEKTLMNKGPQSAGSWWKIRQTLILFSDPGLCATSTITSLLYYTCSIVSIATSVTLIIVTTRKPKFRSMYRTTEVSLLIDNFIVYAIIVSVHVSNCLAQRQRHQSYGMLERKKANTAYEVSCIMNLEQELMERDPSMRNRVRLLRGRLVLMQELVSAVTCIDDHDKRVTWYSESTCYFAGISLSVAALSTLNSFL